MRKYLNRLCFLSCLLFFAGAANSVEVDNFPENCSEASTRYPLDGHIIRLGMVQMSYQGPVFSFPDRDEPDGLQEVEIADNVGLIGQNPNRNYSSLIKLGTPKGSFVVAQLFIGDDNLEPIVTCLSRVRPLSSYVWSDYGTSWRWLDPGVFRERLRWKKHSRWNWRKFNRSDVSDIRRKFRDRSESRRFKRADRDHKSEHIRNMKARQIKKADMPKSKPNRIIELAAKKAAAIKKKLLEEEAARKLKKS